METIHLVSHTHWDREWYLTFQQFRLKLVHLIDRLLEILEKDPNFKYFLLDGQAIILEDYLQIRPDRELDLIRFIKSGRLLIGPWYISPDEYLVSPESHIRNLLEGDQLCQKYGEKMLVGYLPDNFGHIGQMPQILQGFGIDAACAWRGLEDQPCELIWQAADGSQVLLSYLRESYSNAANLTPSLPQKFSQEIDERSAALSEKTLTDQVLLMNGTDHMEPSNDLTNAIARYQEENNHNQLIHSSLPLYFDSIRSKIASTGVQLPVITGELRSSKHAALLQNVLSTRIWLKQRNHSCETDLLKWVEPLSAFTSMLDYGAPIHTYTLSGYSDLLSKRDSIIRYAWKLLMQCHPHDSICGTSIDQVAKEMDVRFDQVEQINHELISQSLHLVCEQIDTTMADHPLLSVDRQDLISAILVFNPNDAPQTDLITLNLVFSDPVSSFEIIDDQGTAHPYDQIGLGRRELISMKLDKKSLKQALGMINDGVAAGMAIRNISIEKQGKLASIRATLTDHGEVDGKNWKQGIAQVEEMLADPGVAEFYVHAYSDPEINLSFVAKGVPGHGYRCYWIRRNIEISSSPSKPIKLTPFTKLMLPLIKYAARIPLLQLMSIRKRRSVHAHNIIENEFLQVEIRNPDNSIYVTDKHTGQVYTDLQQFIDTADCGDLYNYCPLERDISLQAKVTRIEQEFRNTCQKLILYYDLNIPEVLQSAVIQEVVKLFDTPIKSTLTVVPGVPRIDIHTEIDNHASDHRLRVHFPAPFTSTHSHQDGHFEIVQRPIGIREYDQSWEEPPRPEAPQRQFTSITNDQLCLTIANRGLPEVEVLKNQAGNSEIAITLLRCVGWLSRDDLKTRKGHAGPMGITTPEAQLMGRFSFDYSIIPGKNWQESLHQAYAFNAPLKSIPTAIHTGVLAPVGSFVENPNPNFIITAIKLAEDNSDLIVRGFNILSTPIEVSLKPWKSFAKSSLVRLDEKLISPLAISPLGVVSTQVEGNKIVTIRFSG